MGDMALWVSLEVSLELKLSDRGLFKSQDFELVSRLVSAFPELAVQI